jgi:hypothetical protein
VAQLYAPSVTMGAMRSSPLRRTRKLLRLLTTDPLELYDQAVGRVELRRDRRRPRPATARAVSWEAYLPELEARLDRGVRRLLEERQLADIEAHVRRQLPELMAEGPVPGYVGASFSLARVSYLLCRTIRPAVVVETGVAYGVIAAFVSKALEANGRGVMHGIDWTPRDLGAEPFVGALVPAELRPRWRLHRGPSRRILPRVLREVGGVGMFIHDSLHTYRTIHMELRRMQPYLTPPAAVLVDDAHMNSAFSEWAERASPEHWAVVSEDVRRWGIALFLRQ